MASAKLSGLALAEFAIGVIFIWSGIKNATLQATATALIQGKNPQTASGVVGGGAWVAAGELRNGDSAGRANDGAGASERPFERTGCVLVGAEPEIHL